MTRTTLEPKLILLAQELQLVNSGIDEFRDSIQEILNGGFRWEVGTTFLEVGSDTRHVFQRCHTFAKAGVSKRVTCDDLVVQPLYQLYQTINQTHDLVVIIPECHVS